MKIYTYYNKIPNFDVSNEEKLISIWKESWKQWGWEPVVINEETAKRHPQYSYYKSKFDALPTINGHAYETACYMRWIAMAVVGGGYMVDYDVMNYGFLPPITPTDRLTLYFQVEASQDPFYNAVEDQARMKFMPKVDLSAEWAWIVPCLVSGSAHEYLRGANLFANHRVTPFDVLGGRAHCSDQNLLTYHRFDGSYDLKPIGRYFANHRDWADAPLVHYANGTMAPRGYSPRCNHIKRVRPFLRTLTRAEFPAFFNMQGLTGTGVEIGVAHGEFSEIIAANWNGKLFSIDPWRIFAKEEYKDCINDQPQAQMDAMANFAINRLKPYKNCEVIRATGHEAVGRFADGSLDFCYIDGNHNYHAIKEDLADWWPKIKAGGYLCGHDFYNAQLDWLECGVEKAVREFAEDNKLKIRQFECSSWMIQK